MGRCGGTLVLLTDGWPRPIGTGDYVLDFAPMTTTIFLFTSLPLEQAVFHEWRDLRSTPWMPPLLAINKVRTKVKPPPYWHATLPALCLVHGPNLLLLFCRRAEEVQNAKQPFSLKKWFQDVDFKQQSTLWCGSSTYFVIKWQVLRKIFKVLKAEYLRRIQVALQQAATLQGLFQIPTSSINKYLINTGSIVAVSN